ncbi:MAG: UDP-N-acetylmuramoyl-L-alanyl-D-glutamate--2,6-diaminopimelate ligase, partial [Pseudomonadota bacterium]
LDFEGNPDQEIKGLAYDSRRVEPGYLFVAVKGHKEDGTNFLQDAIRRGAVALIAEGFPSVETGVSKIHVLNSREALSKLALKFYNYPLKNINLIGITGTNGKTTTSYLLESILLTAGMKPGVLGTINYRYMGKVHKASVTTPESLDLMRLLRDMVDEGVTDVIMEVSSHALDQKRTRHCPFRVGIFTNFSRDHLDYHGTMEDYFKAKSLLFKDLPKWNLSENETYAVINMDDAKGGVLAGLTKARVISYGLNVTCHVRAESISANKTGLKAKLVTPFGHREIRSHLLGEMNIYNILAASAAALSLKIPLDAVIEGIDHLRGVPGRLEKVGDNRGIMIVVDYAHTPDALLKTLKTLRPLSEGRLITVFGCGGDRDRGKRYEMGFVVGKNTDLAIITSDNPRGEDPLSIIAQIQKGIEEAALKRLDLTHQGEILKTGYFIEEDRRKAIEKAISMACRKDLVLIAGKGHEDYQIIGSKTIHFDDREEADKAVSQLIK